MKNGVIFFSFIIALTSCNSTNIQIKERISNADSVAINYFKGDGTMDTVIAVKIVSDKKILEQLTHLIAASSTEANAKCGYDGSLHFFKKDMVVQDINFRMNDVSCMYFSFIQKGQRGATVLLPEAKNLLISIRNNAVLTVR